MEYFRIFLKLKLKTRQYTITAWSNGSLGQSGSVIARSKIAVSSASSKNFQVLAQSATVIAATKSEKKYRLTVPLQTIPCEKTDCLQW